MVSPTLKAYVDDCARQSCILADVRATLLSTGWPESEVNEALIGYVVAPMAATPQATSRPAGSGRKVAMVAGLTVAVILVVVGVPVAFAEQGFLPALSKTYRSINISAAWNGLPGKPSLAVAEAFAAVSKIKAVSVTTKGSITVSGATQSASSASVSEALRKGLALLQSGGLVNRSLADISADSATATVPAAADYSQYLPITVSTVTTVRADASGNNDLGFSADITSLLAKVPAIKEILPNIPDTVTGEALTAASGKTYFKSNAIPYAQDDDKAKWLSYTLPPSDSGQTDTSVQKALGSLTADQKRDLSQIADGLLKDQGVERPDGRPEAHYQANLSAASLNALKQKYPDNQYIKDSDMASLQGSGSLVIDLWIGEFDHLPYRLKIVDEGPVGVGTEFADVSIRLSSDSSLTYAGIQPVTLPSDSEVIPGDAFDYIMGGTTDQATAQ